MAKKNPKVEPEIVEDETVENQEVTQLKADYLRALADYQNLERRTASQMSQMRKSASQGLLLQILEVMDDIDRAEVFVQDQGLIHVKSKIQRILDNSNVKEMDLKGKDFDPYLAECIDLVEGEENKIVGVLQKGYYLDGEILRTAKVSVGKK